MPPKKSPFMCFVNEWRNQPGHKNLSMEDSVARAGEIWKNLSEDKRERYVRLAKMESFSNPFKHTAPGAASFAPPSTKKIMSKAALENVRVQKAISDTVDAASMDGSLPSHSFLFISANYYCISMQNNLHIPAEITVSKYSIEGGVRLVFHTIINPGNEIFGNQYCAQRHSAETHNLPLPPTAIGTTDLTSVYKAILKAARDADSKGYIPLYTQNDCIVTVNSVLEFLMVNSDAQVDCKLSIYPIEQLLYKMKQATSAATPELRDPVFLRFVVNAHFDRDYFEFTSGLACEFHEKLDRSRYCTQSLVIRWGYMFSDLLCKDLKVTITPGRHFPVTVNVNELKRNGFQVDEAVLPVTPEFKPPISAPKPDEQEYENKNQSSVVLKLASNLASCLQLLDSTTTTETQALPKKEPQIPVAQKTDAVYETGNESSMSVFEYDSDELDSFERSDQSYMADDSDDYGNVHSGKMGANASQRCGDKVPELSYYMKLVDSTTPVASIRIDSDSDDCGTPRKPIRPRRDVSSVDVDFRRSDAAEDQGAGAECYAQLAKWTPDNLAFEALDCRNLRAALPDDLRFDDDFGMPEPGSSRSSLLSTASMALSAEYNSGRDLEEAEEYELERQSQYRMYASFRSPQQLFRNFMRKMNTESSDSDSKTISEPPGHYFKTKASVDTKNHALEKFQSLNNNDDDHNFDGFESDSTFTGDCKSKISETSEKLTSNLSDTSSDITNCQRFNGPPSLQKRTIKLTSPLVSGQDKLEDEMAKMRATSKPNTECEASKNKGESAQIW